MVLSCFYKSFPLVISTEIFAYQTLYLDCFTGIQWGQRWGGKAVERRCDKSGHKALTAVAGGRVTVLVSLLSCKFVILCNKKSTKKLN